MTAGGDDALQFEVRSVEPVVVDQIEQQAALALGCILLENLRRAGASRIPQGAMEGALGRVLPHLSSKVLMDLEVEAYEMLAWIGRSIDPSLVDETHGAGEGDDGARRVGPVPFDPDQAATQIIRRALREGFDLQIVYYTGGRGELSRRVITPLRIEAEKYLHAWCHKREDERVFRMSRIASAEPVGGIAVRSRKPPPPKPPAKTSSGQAGAEGRRGSRPPHQTSLFDPGAPGDGE